MNLQNSNLELFKELEISKNQISDQIEKKELKIKEKEQDIDNFNNLLTIEIQKQIKFTVYEKILKEWIDIGLIKSEIPLTLQNYIRNIKTDLELVIKNDETVLKTLDDLFRKSENSLIEKVAKLNTMNEFKTQKSELPQLLNKLSKLKVTTFHFLNKIKINSENVNIVLRLINPFIEHKLTKLQKYKDAIIQNRNQKQDLKKIFIDNEYLIRKTLNN